MKDVVFKDLGLINYQEAWDLQKKYFNELLNAKKTGNQHFNQYILYCEHSHVFTLGKSGNSTNLLVNDAILKERGIDFYQIDRGGDITYHGPGQLVVYPIIDLDNYGINTREYVYRLEDAVIKTLEEFSISAVRLNGAAGIWLNSNGADIQRKICAIGIKSSHRITMHGIALNVNTDLSYFGLMNPCGFTDKGTTSMEKEKGRIVELNQVKAVLTKMLYTNLFRKSQ